MIIKLNIIITYKKPYNYKLISSQLYLLDSVQSIVIFNKVWNNFSKELDCFSICFYFFNTFLTF